MSALLRQLLAAILSFAVGISTFAVGCPERSRRDGDGNRVSKTIAGATTKYLVDTENPTGYAQVIAEISGPLSNVQIAYVYGLEQISQNRRFASSNPISYFVHDGHGSVRALTDPTGAVTDTYDYDAFGNLIHSSTTLSSPTPNNYLFAGEQFDADLRLYYNRARYLNVSAGRFWTMDSYQGDAESPPSLHKYAYADGSPVDQLDPSGNFGLDEVMATLAVATIVFSMSGCTSTPKLTLPVEVRILQNWKQDHGVWLDLGAKTKSRSPSYPEYNWVQWVTTNAIERNLKKYLQPNVPFRDPARPQGAPPYYYVGNEERPSFSGYDLGFHDNPSRDPSQYPETGGNIDWNARLLLVGISPPGSNSYNPIIQITWGFHIRNGNITTDDVLIVQCGEGGCGQ